MNASGGAGHQSLPPYLPRLLNRLTAPHTAPAPILRLHKWLYEHTDGRIGPGMIGAWTLLLGTIGRRSGQRRLTALIFARDGGRLILAASNDGEDHTPAWFLNLTANPSVTVQIARTHGTGMASVMNASDPDYPRLWKLMNETNNRRYDYYQSQTRRPIPIVVITPDQEG